MVPESKEKSYLLFRHHNHEKALRQHHSGQKVRFENEEAEIIRISPLLVIKTKDRIVCGALHHRIEHLAA